MWDDIGFLISKNRYNENSLIVEIYTEKHGKVSGIVFGGTSKKIKNYLQIGNKLFVNYNSKNDSRIGYFKIEIMSPLTPLYFDNNRKLSCIASTMNMIKILTAEFQSNTNIYNLIDTFYEVLESKDWIKNCIFWELELFRLLGYDLELKNMVTKEIINEELNYYAKSSSEKKSVPNFLIDKEIEVNDIKVLLKGFKLVSDFLDKTILKPNNINYPITRTHFLNLLK
tara:strand:- start:1611 stop:2288 length:678 start_codon:yes stop_codon:yes gene_type:complete